jgi:O-acetyl-ADP-ribose deacetylase (regulator of RNase III)
MTIRLMLGDLLKQDDVDAIVNTVNCVGVMGKGIALQFRNKWPANNQAYELACKAGQVKLGKMFVFDSGGLVKPNFIINFPTKGHWRAKSEIKSIQDGLKDLVAEVRRLNIKSIAIPPLGCGNGGLDWDDVRPLIVDAFKPLADVEVRLFEPVGAPAAKAMEVRTAKPKMTPGRAAILKVLDTYRALGYGLSKIEVQKLAYFLQEAGQGLKLTFVPHEYGPYSDQLRHVLNRMEGHYIRGVGDGVVDAEIEPMPNALAEADVFLQEDTDGSSLNQRIAKVEQLIDGFQSPYGMELLATVYWVSRNSPFARNHVEALQAVRGWNERKRQLMQPSHVKIAWDRLVSESWISESPQKVAASN